MLRQEPVPTTYKPPIFIPEIKRFKPQIRQAQLVGPNYLSFSHESPFQFLKIQLQNIKPQLGLITQKSGFTKVSSVEDDCPDSFKQQNTRATFLNQDSENYKVDLQKFIELLEKSECKSLKDKKQLTLNTKNILRNVCNAQNQYILFNGSAQKIICSRLKDISQFKAWINKLRLHTFEEFQKVWSCRKRPLFTKLYKNLCRKFYIQNAIPYIINSRIRNKQTKLAHIQYMYRFLQGLEQPEKFFYFKQKQKQKQQNEDILIEN